MVPILTYHAIGDHQSPLFTSTAMFEAQLSSLAAAGYETISLPDVINWLNGEGEIPKRSVVLTFDDGYASICQTAWPMLKSFGFGATIFLVTGFTGKDNQWPGQPKSVPVLPLMSWSDVSEMSAEGCLFEAHTRSHPPLSRLNRAQIADELAVSRLAIEDNTGRRSHTFAYPYGDRGREVEDLVRQQFDGAVTTRLGVVTSADDPYDLPRIDAFYLQPKLIPMLHTGRFRTYLRVRQGLRWMRRIVKPDWQPGAPFV